MNHGQYGMAIIMQVATRNGPGIKLLIRAGIREAGLKHFRKQYYSDPPHDSSAVRVSAENRTAHDKNEFKFSSQQSRPLGSDTLRNRVDLSDWCALQKQISHLSETKINVNAQAQEKLMSTHSDIESSNETDFFGKYKKKGNIENSSESWNKKKRKYRNVTKRTAHLNAKKRTASESMAERVSRPRNFLPPTLNWRRQRRRTKTDLE